MGSTRTARRAGTYAATNDTSAMQTTTAPYTSGSRGLVVYSRLLMNRVAAIAAGTPSATPMTIRRPASASVFAAMRPRDAPSALRYPRGEGRGIDMPEVGVALEVGKGRIVREGTKIALLSFGTRLAECEKAADELAAHGLSTTIADARFMKPLDTELVLKLARDHEILITIEEGSVGGFGSHVAQYLTDQGALDSGLVRFRTMVLPDVFQDHDDPGKQYDEAGLNAPHIVDTVLKALRHNSAGVEEARA